MKKQIFALLTGLLFLVSCGDDEVIDEPTVCPQPIPQKYELESIEFTPDTCGFDTVPGDSTICYFKNPTSEMISVSKSASLESLTLSTFYAPNEQLPEGNNITEILTQIPNIDGEPKVVGLTINQFPFSFGEKQELRKTSGNRTWETKVPPHKTLRLTYWYIGYELTATYHAILKNEYTGERLELTGKWRGLQQINSETVLDEISNP